MKSESQVYRALWVEALRSGKYKQGHFRLRNKNNEFCCLGVACDVIDPGGWRKTTYGYAHRDTFGGHMPPYIRQLLGIEEKDTNDLVELNDAYRKSFDEIADRIERVMFP